MPSEAIAAASSGFRRRAVDESLVPEPPLPAAEPPPPAAEPPPSAEPPPPPAAEPLPPAAEPPAGVFFFDMY
jgi:hypothetical protein